MACFVKFEGGKEDTDRLLTSRVLTVRSARNQISLAKVRVQA